MNATLGQVVELAAACVRDGVVDGPGIPRDVVVHAPGTLTVSGIAVDDGVVLVEAEQLHNCMDDGGYDAFYTYGPAERPASNGVAMVPHRTLDGPVALDRRIDLPLPAYEVWLLTHTVSSACTRAARGCSSSPTGSRSRTSIPGHGSSSRSGTSGCTSSGFARVGWLGEGSTSCA